jgi:hypothetical protein
VPHSSLGLGYYSLLGALPTVGAMPVVVGIRAAHKGRTLANAAAEVDVGGAQTSVDDKHWQAAGSGGEGCNEHMGGDGAQSQAIGCNAKRFQR